MEHKVWDSPMYSAAMAARLTKVSPQRVARWLHGYTYTLPNGDEKITRSKGPIVKRQGAAESKFASFLDLIDLLFIDQFLRNKISIYKLRRAIKEAEELTGSHHFAQKIFFTSAKNIYLQVKESGKSSALLQLCAGGQWVIGPVIEPIATRIDFDKVTKHARKWYPLGKEYSVVVDPSVAFGRPSIVKRGVTTSAVNNLYIAEGEKIEPVCEWMNLEIDEVKHAIKFERWMAAA